MSDDAPACPDCGDETYVKDNGLVALCDMCSADRARVEPGTGCMGH